MCIHHNVKNKEQTLLVFSRLSTVFDARSFTDLELAKQARLGDYIALGIYLSLPSSSSVLAFAGHHA